MSGQNNLELLLNAAIPSIYNSTDVINTAPKIIKDMINKAKGLAKSVKYIIGITAELKSLGGYIDDTSNGVGSFAIPASGYHRTDTPVFQQIEELSNPIYTGVDPNTVGAYIYYVDTSNNFHL